MKLLPNVTEYIARPIGQLTNAVLYDENGGPITQMILVPPVEMRRLMSQPGGDTPGIPRRFCWIVDQPPADWPVDKPWRGGKTRVFVQPPPGAPFELRLTFFPPAEEQ